MAEQRIDPRGKKIGERLMGYLDDGESFVVRYEGGEMRVFDGDEEAPVALPSRLAYENPRLYGHLVRVQGALSSAGAWLQKLLWLAAILVVIGLVSHLLDDLLGVDLDASRSIVLYLALLGVAGFLGHFVGAFFERLRYRALEGDLHDAIDGAGLDVETVLAWTARDASISKAVERLQADPPRRAPARY